MSQATETGERLLRDIFPVELYAPAAMSRPERARVFITTTRLTAYVARDGAIVKVVDTETTGQQVDPQRGSFTGQLAVETADGLVHLTKTGGCGCHSPLKALDPPAGW